MKKGEIALNSQPYELKWIESNCLEVPRSTYQRELSLQRVRRIALEFDEKIANEPKVSSRDGSYYVFDGQHTIAAREFLNGGRHLPVQCKVYYNLSEQEEALLFAQQTGVSTKLTGADQIRAEAFGGDPEAAAFLAATQKAGFMISPGHTRGKNRIACVNTALREFRQVGKEHYLEALMVIAQAWKGQPDSLRSDVLQGVIRFVDLYHEEYDPQRLIQNLSAENPLVIGQQSRLIGISGYKRYLVPVYSIYNSSGRRGALPMRF